MPDVTPTPQEQLTLRLLHEAIQWQLQWRALEDAEVWAALIQTALCGFSAMLKDHIGALIVGPSPTFFGERRRLAALAEKHQLPTMFTLGEYARAGGLMSYGPHYPDQFRRAASFVDKILKGTKPADLPVEQPTKFELVINLKTAKALGLTIPPSVLARADAVIE